MKKSLSESKQELQDVIHRVRDLIATNLESKSMQEIEDTYRRNNSSNRFDLSNEIRSDRDQSIQLLQQIQYCLKKESLAELKEVLKQLDQVSNRLQKSYDYYKGYSAIFYPLIPLNNLCRAFLRLVDVLTTGGNTWNKTGRTPLAKEILGTNQFFALSPKEEIRAATKQFNEAKLAFEMAITTSDETIPELAEAVTIDSFVPPVAEQAKI